jgi:hypothetical protein
MRGLKHVEPLDWSEPDQPETPIPAGCSVAELVHEGRHYAYVITKGQKGASDVVHITPLGHAELGRRLRALVKGTP